MTVPAPYSLPQTSSWQLADWLDHTYTGTADGTGVALITLDQLPSSERWQLTHAVAGVSAADGSPTTAKPVMRLYLDQVTNFSLRDGTDKGAFNVADWAAGLMIPPSRSLLARWSGCNPGDVAYLSLQANILRLAGS